MFVPLQALSHILKHASTVMICKRHSASFPLHFIYLGSRDVNVRHDLARS
jgi:hypothetical protein